MITETVIHNQIPISSILLQTDFSLDDIPPQTTRDTFKFLLHPEAPDAAQKAVSAIYSYMFWEDKEGSNQQKLDAALQDKDTLFRWIKDRADKSLNVFNDLIGMAERASVLYQTAYNRAGMQLKPDENEDVYESLVDLLKAKEKTTNSDGEKYELAWMASVLIPEMKARGLNVEPLVGDATYYTKFRHWGQSIRQRDRVMDAASKRFNSAKTEAAQKITRAKDPSTITALENDLIKIIEQETTVKQELLADYGTAISEGFADIVNPDTTVKQIDEKWRRKEISVVEAIGRGTGYTAIISGQKTILIAEFDYSFLSAIEVIVAPMIDVKGMTDPLLIVKQLRDYADAIEKTLGGQ